MLYFTHRFIEEGKMTIAFNALQKGFVGYAAIFVCIGFGFLFLRKIDKNETSLSYWTIGFFLNALGFLFWSGIIMTSPVVYYLVGEVFHVSGFFLLVFGAHRFSGIRHGRKRLCIFSAFWWVLWIFSVLMLRKNPVFSAVSLKLLRAVLFLISGIFLLIKNNSIERVGRNIAGVSLVLWTVFITVSVWVSIDEELFIGFLVGFQILAAFGMVAMVMDKMRASTEKMEKRAQQLEGILPICCYCKKIRDENNEWRILEEYIEDRSKAEFSHGICPECFAKYRPNKD